MERGNPHDVEPGLPATETAQNWMVAKALAGVAIMGLALSACSAARHETDRPLSRNAPPSAEYFLDSDGPYFQELDHVRKTTDNPTAEKNIERLMHTPYAQWLNESPGDTQQSLQENLANAKAEHSIPVFALYNIPNRDLGGDSKGGMPDASSYKEWVDLVSDTIGAKPTVLVLEPDALADIPDMKNAARRDERIRLLRYALTTFQDHNQNTAVYLDAGNSQWLTPQEAADLIRQVDPERKLVASIALNVSSTRPETETRAYADQISKLLGYPLYVLIDNSLNGAPDTATITEICNPPGAKIGSLDDTRFDRNNRVEEIYVKVAGESGGKCGVSNKSAGEFDVQLLLREVS